MKLLRAGLTMSVALSLCGTASADLWIDPNFRVEIAANAGFAASSAALGLAVDSSGRLFVSDSVEARINELGPRFHDARTVLSGLPLATPGQMIFGNGTPLVGNDLIVADWNSDEVSDCCEGRVFRIDPNTGHTSVIAIGNPAFPHPGDPIGVALADGGAFGDGLYVMDFQGASPHPPVLYSVDQDGNASPFVIDDTLWTTDRRPSWLEFDLFGTFGGDLFVSDPAPVDPGLWRVDPSGGLKRFALDRTLENPAGMAFGLGGSFGHSLYLLDRRVDGGTIWKIEPDGSTSLLVRGLQMHHLGGELAFSPDGSTLYVSSADVVYSIRDHGAWRTYGDGLAGTDGSPGLVGGGIPKASEDVVLSYYAAAPSTTALVVLGFNELNAPLFGGTMYPSPDFLLAGLPTGTGRLFLRGRLPAGFPPGIPLYFQTWVADATGPHGFTATNALEMVSQ